ncbi:MAG: 6-phosphogluconolactonase [Chlamydiales bacterium]|nr:6-phosphogluconolactonase [Chlamydiales bacterium]
MKKEPLKFDERRLLALPGEADETLAFAVENWLEIAAESIADHGFFAVALSGGSTPKKIFQALSEKPKVIDWKKVYLFWGDERSVVPTDSDSNYHMALEQGGLKKLPILKEHIFRMVAESDIEANAVAYEKIIQEKLGAHPFDLVMLGMGDDGHTASLFPHTEALHVEDRLVVANHVPQKETWRMSLTYPCINRARHIALYVMGSGKSEVLEKVLTSELNPELYPSQKIGTRSNPALWIVDLEASQNLLAHLN